MSSLGDPWPFPHHDSLTNLTSQSPYMFYLNFDFFIILFSFFFWGHGAGSLALMTAVSGKKRPSRGAEKREGGTGARDGGEARRRRAGRPSWRRPSPRRRVPVAFIILFSSVQFSLSVVSDSLRPHEQQHARPLCPSPTPRVHPNPCPLSQWCHPTISSSVIPFSSCLQSFPASGSLFQWVSSSHQVAKVLEFQLQHPGLISFRIDWLHLLAVQGTLKSLLQHHSSKASILRHSAFFTVQLSHSYMTTGKTIALTRRTLEPFNFRVFRISGWVIDLIYCDTEWFALETNRDSSTAFWTLLLTIRAAPFLPRNSCPH